MYYARFTLPESIQEQLDRYWGRLKCEYDPNIPFSLVVRRLLMTHPDLTMTSSSNSQQKSSVGHPREKDIPSPLPDNLNEFSYEHWTELMRYSDGALNVAFSMAREKGLTTIFEGGINEEIPKAFEEWENAGRPKRPNNSKRNK